MKRLISLFIVIMAFTQITMGQTEKSYSDYLIKETNPVVLKYTDPYFPSEAIVPGVKNDKMEEYAKLHPPITLQRNTGDLQYDKSKCAQDQSSWLQTNPYYPQFVPYHLYNALLTVEDDIAFYEAAKAAWERANPEKVAEILGTSK